MSTFECNGFCGDIECGEHKGDCKRVHKGSAEIIPFVKPKQKCSFCGIELKPGSLCFDAIDGHCICLGCIGRAKQRLEEARKHDPN